MTGLAGRGGQGRHGSDRRPRAWLTTIEIVAIDKTDALVVVPVGAVEQHGPHLPFTNL